MFENAFAPEGTRVLSALVEAARHVREGGDVLEALDYLVVAGAAILPDATIAAENEPSGPRSGR